MEIEHDTDMQALEVGKIYGLHHRDGSPDLGGIYARWDGKQFLDEVTREVVCPRANGWNRAMRASP